MMYPKPALSLVFLYAIAALANSAACQPVVVRPPSVPTADTSYQCERTWQAHTQWIRGIAFCPHGERLSSVSDDDRLIVWDCATANPILKLSGNSGGFTCLAISRDGNRFVAGGWKGSVQVYDAERGKRLLQLKGPRGERHRGGD
jgi:WD40 repeat protein